MAVRADGSGEREVIGRDANLSIADVAVADDGAIAVLAFDAGASTASTSWRPAWRCGCVDGDGPRRLTDAETIDLGEVGSHITPVGRRLPRPGPDARDASGCCGSSAGRVDVELLGGDVEVGGHAAAGERTVAAVATPDSFGELVLIEGGEFAYADVVRRAEWSTSGRASSRSRAGTAIRSTAGSRSPQGRGRSRFILQIHGGPYAAYGIHLFDETQVLVDAGYAVVYCNPRGSAGYGRAHGRSIRGAMGTVDFAGRHRLPRGRRRSRSAPRRRSGGHHGRVVRGIPHRVGDRARSPLRRCHRRTRVPRSGVLRGHERHRLVLRRRVRRDRSGCDRAADADGGGRSGHAPRPSSSIPSSTTAARSSRRPATTARSSGRGRTAELLVFPGEDHELTRSGRPRHRRRALRRGARLVAPDSAGALTPADATKRRPG